MTMLLWKDFRLSRIVLLAGVMLAAAPYVILAPVQEFRAAWSASAYVSQLLMGLLAGNIIACERADRSAEFLAFQGTSRASVLTSKAVICLLAYVVICAVMVVTGKLLQSATAFSHSWHFQLTAAATGLALWGCCWLLSSILESPVLAITLGAAGPMFVYAGLSSVDSPSLKGKTFMIWYAALCIILGVAAFASGSILYLNRREP